MVVSKESLYKSYMQQLSFQPFSPDLLASPLNPALFFNWLSEGTLIIS